MPTVIPSENPLANACTPHIYNVTLGQANTEYPQTLPTNVRKFSIQPRNSSHVIKMAYESGKSGAEYITIDSRSYFEDFIGVSTLVLYMQSPTAGAVVEIVAWC